MRAITSPDGIDTLDFVTIGGIGQWIEVRRESEKNPILLFLHGRPGTALFLQLGRFRDFGRNIFSWCSRISAAR
jgi:hypothetical protein